MTKDDSHQPELAAQLKMAKDEIVRLRRMVADREYMCTAYRNMLGPKGLEVADMWDERGVQRIHFSWAQGADALSGEDRAGYILAFENTLREEP
ncbi:hypothetical protein GN330_22880 [Nitratireductor sp. CAU 1489]|uniref:Uncharacterized protein n=1 Tax=Nitratireductor arenosus TaxID=2682096 RepID=A0A844QND1_9HYPH|nr:hypothetical protein [Nitratireductor arenosus]MVB00095.1 hypothetical protein [Nitratireductor arenosus]